MTATTLSREQHALATARVQEAGLSDRVDVRLEDYRDLRGRYDRLVSIEMIEAVGWEYFEDFFRVCCEGGFLERHIGGRAAALREAPGGAAC